MMLYTETLLVIMITFLYIFFQKSMILYRLSLSAHCREAMLMACDEYYSLKITYDYLIEYEHCS